MDLTQDLCLILSKSTAKHSECEILGLKQAQEVS